MVNNKEEKSLDISKNSIFNKVKNWFKNLFKKPEIQREEHKTIYEDKEHDIEIAKRNDFVDSIKIEEKESKEDEELIENFEKSIITFEDLTEEMLETLNKIYDRRINSKSKMIENKIIEINMLKQKLKNA